MTEKDLQKLYAESLNTKKDEKTITGTVIQISSKGEIFVDFKYKADGIIPKGILMMNLKQEIQLQQMF